MSLIGKVLGRIRAVLRYNSSRYYLARFLEDASAQTSEGSVVLDAGAGDGRYQKYFQHAQYEAADICILERNYDAIMYQCDLSEIPVEDGRFDVVVCTQVLEHVPEPAAVLLELRRVLKDGGTLYLTAPLYYPEHEVPYDFFRYTQFGFRKLFEDAGLQVDSVEWLEGYFMTLSTQMWIACDALKLGRLKGLGWLALPVILLIRLLFPLFAAVLGRLDTVFRLTSAGHCKNYALIAHKADASVVGQSVLAK